MKKKIVGILLSITTATTLFVVCENKVATVNLIEKDKLDKGIENVVITEDISDTAKKNLMDNHFNDHSINTVTEKIVDYETLGIKEYEYPSEFYMGDNLKTAITQLALSYENFNKDSISNENWKEDFIAKFIQNSRLSFDYLDRISNKNNGQISTKELNYIQYSLTNTELDFSSYVDSTVNRNDSASSLNYGWISEYDYEYTNIGVVITANFEVGYDGIDSIQKREITVELIKNPYSCFDGYSVIAVSSKTVTSSFQNKANNDNQIKKDDELENLIGEYDYLSDDGIGKLIIKKTSYGYDISDYESESSYRFLADSSNIETIENNRIYIKYPEQVFSDDTVIFNYYILEYSTDEIKVYYRKSVLEEAQFLYHAIKKNEEDIDNKNKSRAQNANSI